MRPQWCAYLSLACHDVISQVHLISYDSDSGGGRKTRKILHVFHGHDEGVQSVAHAFPDGTRIVSGSRDNTIPSDCDTRASSVACLIPFCIFRITVDTHSSCPQRLYENSSTLPGGADMSRL